MACLLASITCVMTIAQWHVVLIQLGPIVVCVTVCPICDSWFYSHFLTSLILKTSQSTPPLGEIPVSPLYYSWSLGSLLSVPVFKKSKNIFACHSPVNRFSWLVRKSCSKRNDSLEKTPITTKGSSSIPKLSTVSGLTLQGGVQEEFRTETRKQRSASNVARSG